MGSAATQPPGITKAAAPPPGTVGGHVRDLLCSDA
jgi:hypothetical protein